MAVRLEHSGNAAPTTLSTSITNVATSINITSASGWPSGSIGPFYVTIDAGTASEEKVLCASRAGTVLTVTTRGADGTTATSHASGAAIIHSYSATEADEANALTAAVTTAGGSVVTTSGTQTLTSKTLTAPVITGASGSVVTTTATQTLTGKTVALGSNTVSGTLAQFNTAVTDADLVSLTGAETLTNKTLTAPLGDVARGAGGAYAQVTADSSTGPVTSASGITDLSGLTATLTVAAGRRVRVTVDVSHALSTTTGSVSLYIREGGTVLRRVRKTVAANDERQDQYSVVLTPTAAAHTYKASVSVSAGSWRVLGDGTGEMISHILVEDIGT